MTDFGLIHVYMGTGKGKTTAALGLVLRAVGYGARAAVVQFMKGNMYSGEIFSLARFSDRVDLYKFGWSCPHSPMIRSGMMRCQKCGQCFRENRNPDNRYAPQALETAGKLLHSGRYQLLVLDEVGNALRRNLLSVQAVLGLLKNRPEGIEVILTGREMPEEIIAEAHYVTEVTPVKHPFHRGVESRRGIEY